jgi:hypothetical protein
LKFARERERFKARDLPFPPGTLDVIRALNALVSLGLLEVVDKAPVPEPAPPKPAPPHRGEIENVLETLEGKRSAPPAPPRVGSEARPDPPAPVEIPPAAASRDIPPSRLRSSPGALLAIAAIAVLLGVALSLRRDEAARSDAVVAFDSAPPEPEPVATAAPPESPEGPPATLTEPSDAELFFSANVAFENGDFERSKAELTALLERQPGFAAAREPRRVGRPRRNPRVAEAGARKGQCLRTRAASAGSAGPARARGIARGGA